MSIHKMTDGNLIPVTYKYKHVNNLLSQGCVALKTGDCPFAQHGNYPLLSGAWKLHGEVACWYWTCTVVGCTGCGAGVLASLQASGPIGPSPAQSIQTCPTAVIPLAWWLLLKGGDGGSHQSQCLYLEVQLDHHGTSSCCRWSWRTSSWVLVDHMSLVAVLEAANIWIIQ